MSTDNFRDFVVGPEGLSFLLYDLNNMPLYDKESAVIHLGSSAISVVRRYDQTTRYGTVEFTGGGLQLPVVRVLGEQWVDSAGRNPDNTLHIPHNTTVSRHHARIDMERPGIKGIPELTVYNLGSLNGTTVSVDPARVIDKSESGESARGREFIQSFRFGVSERPREKGFRSQDRSLADPERGLFGVFDGVGGHRNGEAAANYVCIKLKSDAMKYQAPQFISTRPENAVEWLTDRLNSISRHLKAGVELGLTTATVCRIVEQGDREFVAWASVGDSRLYLMRQDKLSQISTDEGYGGSFVTNILGAENESPVTQTGYFEIFPGDRLLLVTDGVTGDKGSDLMHIPEISSILLADPNDDAAARQLVERARKIDDRTAIVVSINEWPSQFQTPAAHQRRSGLFHRVWDFLQE